VTAVRFRALVLAAGRGERLRPLTDRLPKPLLPVAGQPVAAHTLARLAAAGCEAAAINLHHQGELIRKRFGGRFGAMPLTYSEEPERLGTLGALWPLRDFLAAAELVVVINGDSLCRWPVKTLLRRHRARRAAATLLLARRADPAGFGGGVGVDRDRRIVSFRPGGPAAGDADRRWVFAGAQVLSPELLARLRPGPADIVRDLYEPLLGEGALLAGCPTRARWHDLGTPRRYLGGVLDWARGGWPRRWVGRSWVSPEAVVGRGVRLDRVAIEAGARVEAGARLERVVVLEGARIGAGARLRRVVVGPGAVLPSGARIERRLVSRAAEGVAPAATDSRVGGLIYTPLDSAGRGAPGSVEVSSG
jgi:mannose-1-phosphate guanylyltransferase